MKNLKIFWLIILGLIISVKVLPQKGIEDGSRYGHGEDSITCTRNLSLFYEYYKHENYKDAIGPWRVVYNECPRARDYLFAYGVTMYKSFLEATNDKALRNAYCDTIMMIHENRIKYLGEEGKVLGFEGIDLLRYRREDGIEFIKKGYDLLKKSIDLEKVKSSSAVVMTFMTASISLFINKSISNEQVINDYILASEILDEQLKKAPSPKVQEVKDVINANIRESKALTCESIVKIFSPKYEANKDKVEFLKLVAGFMNDSNCEDESFYTTVVERLYQKEPSAEAAYNLARLFLLKRKNPEKAKSYYLEALDRSTDNELKAKLYYELGIVYNQHLKQPQEAVECANEAVKIKSGWGEPYILAGHAYITGKNLIGDDFQQQTVFWVAVDMFQRAKAADPSVSEQAGNLIKEYSAYFPSKEDLFFRSLTDGQSYTVGGWINKTTTVRSR